jgi:hypothetical protein
VLGHVAPGKPSERASEPVDWRNLISRTASALGVMPRAVREDMTLDDVLDLHDYWRDHPPVQWMVQSYLGIGSSQHEMTTDELKAWVG